jgi:hypothetical protein
MSVAIVTYGPLPQCLFVVVIMLLLKQKEASHIKQFCPICLLDVSFKIFTKVKVNRMTEIAKANQPNTNDFYPVHEQYGGSGYVT